MTMTKYNAPASGVLTATIWNNQLNDIQSGLDLEVYGFKTGSDNYVYDASQNLISGIHYSNTGSWYEWYYYSSNTLTSGHILKDGRQVDFKYYYDSNSNLSGVQVKVV